MTKTHIVFAVLLLTLFTAHAQWASCPSGKKLEVAACKPALSQLPWPSLKDQPSTLLLESTSSAITTPSLLLSPALQELQSVVLLIFSRQPPRECLFSGLVLLDQARLLQQLRSSSLRGENSVGLYSLDQNRFLFLRISQSPSPGWVLPNRQWLPFFLRNWEKHRCLHSLPRRQQIHHSFDFPQRIRDQLDVS